MTEPDSPFAVFVFCAIVSVIAFSFVHGKWTTGRGKKWKIAALVLICAPFIFGSSWWLSLRGTANKAKFYCETPLENGGVLVEFGLRRKMDPYESFGHYFSVSFEGQQFRVGDIWLDYPKQKLLRPQAIDPTDPYDCAAGKNEPRRRTTENRFEFALGACKPYLSRSLYIHFLPRGSESLKVTDVRFVEDRGAFKNDKIVNDFDLPIEECD